MAKNRVKLEDVVNQAKEVLEAGNPDYVIALCRYIFKYFPRTLEATRVLGEAYTEKRLLDEADQLFVYALAADPHDVLSYVDRGFIAYERGNLDDAIMYYERSIELDPHIEQLRTELLRLYKERYGSNRAKLRLSKAGLANHRLRDGFTSQAIDEYNAILNETPDRLDIQVWLMEAYWRNRDYIRTEQLALELLETYPYLIKANYILWHIFGIRRHEGQAESYLQKAHALDPLNLIADRLFENVPQSEQALIQISELGVASLPIFDPIGILKESKEKKDQELVPLWVNADPETDRRLGLRGQIENDAAEEAYDQAPVGTAAFTEDSDWLEKLLSETEERVSTNPGLPLEAAEINLPSQTDAQADLNQLRQSESEEVLLDLFEHFEEQPASFKAGSPAHNLLEAGPDLELEEIDFYPSELKPFNASEESLSPHGFRKNQNRNEIETDGLSSASDYSTEVSPLPRLDFAEEASLISEHDVTTPSGNTTFQAAIISESPFNFDLDDFAIVNPANPNSGSEDNSDLPIVTFEDEETRPSSQNSFTNRSVFNPSENYSKEEETKAAAVNPVEAQMFDLDDLDLEESQEKRRAEVLMEDALWDEIKNFEAESSGIKLQGKGPGLNDELSDFFGNEIFEPDFAFLADKPFEPEVDLYAATVPPAQQDQSQKDAEPAFDFEEFDFASSSSTGFESSGSLGKPNFAEENTAEISGVTPIYQAETLWEEPLAAHAFHLRDERGPAAQNGFFEGTKKEEFDFAFLKNIVESSESLDSAPESESPGETLLSTNNNSAANDYKPVTNAELPFQDENWTSSGLENAVASDGSGWGVESDIFAAGEQAELANSVTHAYHRRDERGKVTVHPYHQRDERGPIPEAFLNSFQETLPSEQEHQEAVSIENALPEFDTKPDFLQVTENLLGLNVENAVQPVSYLESVTVPKSTTITAELGDQEVSANAAPEAVRSDKENEAMPIRKGRQDDESNVFDWEREELPDYLRDFAVDENDLGLYGGPVNPPIDSDMTTGPARIRPRDPEPATPGDLPDWLNPANSRHSPEFNLPSNEPAPGKGGGTPARWLNEAHDNPRAGSARPNQNFSAAPSSSGSGDFDFGDLQPFSLEGPDAFGGPALQPPALPGIPPSQARPAQQKPQSAFPPQAPDFGMDFGDLQPFSLDNLEGGFGLEASPPTQRTATPPPAARQVSAPQPAAPETTSFNLENDLGGLAPFNPFDMDTLPNMPATQAQPQPTAPQFQPPSSYTASNRHQSEEVENMLEGLQPFSFEDDLQVPPAAQNYGQPSRNTGQNAPQPRAEVPAQFNPFGDDGDMLAPFNPFEMDAGPARNLPPEVENIAQPFNPPSFGQMPAMGGEGFVEAGPGSLKPFSFEDFGTDPPSPFVKNRQNSQAAQVPFQSEISDLALEPFSPEDPEFGSASPFRGNLEDFGNGNGNQNRPRHRSVQPEKELEAEPGQEKPLQNFGWLKDRLKKQNSQDEQEPGGKSLFEKLAEQRRHNAPVSQVAPAKNPIDLSQSADGQYGEYLPFEEVEGRAGGAETLEHTLPPVETNLAPFLFESETEAAYNNSSVEEVPQFNFDLEAAKIDLPKPFQLDNSAVEAKSPDGAAAIPLPNFDFSEVESAVQAPEPLILNEPGIDNFDFDFGAPVPEQYSPLEPDKVKLEEVPFDFAKAVPEEILEPFTLDPRKTEQVQKEVPLAESKYHSASQINAAPENWAELEAAYITETAVPQQQTAPAQIKPAGNEDVARYLGRVQNNPRDLHANLKVAEFYASEHKLGEALSYYAAAIKVTDPQTLETIVSHLENLTMEGDSNPRFHRVLGDAFMKQGQYPLAMNEFSKALGPSKPRK